MCVGPEFSGPKILFGAANPLQPSQSFSGFDSILSWRTGTQRSPSCWATDISLRCDDGYGLSPSAGEQARTLGVKGKNAPRLMLSGKGRNKKIWLHYPLVKDPLSPRNKKRKEKGRKQKKNKKGEQDNGRDCGNGGPAAAKKKKKRRAFRSRDYFFLDCRGRRAVGPLNYHSYTPPWVDIATGASRPAIFLAGPPRSYCSGARPSRKATA